jgi:hypothetical protein
MILIYLCCFVTVLNKNIIKHCFRFSSSLDEQFYSALFYIGPHYLLV